MLNRRPYDGMPLCPRHGAQLLDQTPADAHAASDGQHHDRSDPKTIDGHPILTILLEKRHADEALVRIEGSDGTAHTRPAPSQTLADELRIERQVRRREGRHHLDIERAEFT